MTGPLPFVSAAGVYYGMCNHGCDDVDVPLNNKMHAVCTSVSDAEPPGDSSAPN